MPPERHAVTDRRQDRACTLFERPRGLELDQLSQGIGFRAYVTITQFQALAPFQGGASEQVD